MGKKIVHPLLVVSMLVLGLCWGGIGRLHAQTKSDKKQLSQTTNKKALLKMIAGFEKEQAQLKKLKRQFSTSYKNKDLIGFGPDGSPLFYERFYISDPNSKKKLQQNSMKLLFKEALLEGKKMEVGVWDQGLPRATHQELFGRVAHADISQYPNDIHATMVSGILLGKGENQEAQGVAPKAAAKNYDWLQDKKEVAQEAANGLLISNHSYGISVKNLPPWYFGAYIKTSQDWDAIHYHAPYFLAVSAAGNHGNGTDKLLGFNTAKNGLSVGATLGEDRHEIAAFSAYGPTDDGRIKPELVTAGVQILSASNLSDESYSQGSGTSYSAPVVSGVALLAQQAYQQAKGRYLKAASLKGLLMHTALDIGAPGPDYQKGWGVLQKQEAIDFIGQLDQQSQLIETTLEAGAVQQYEFTAAAGGLRVSLSWTDLPGTQLNEGQINPSGAQLVHDLDIRLYKNGVAYAPYVLDPTYPMAVAQTGDNQVDPFEQIQVAEAGTYELVVSHKGVLAHPQAYSLLVSGIETAANPPGPVQQAPEELETNPIPEDMMQSPRPQQLKIRAFPNPAVHELRVQGLASKTFRYYLYKANGTVIGKGSSQDGRVPVHRLPSGFYVLGIFHKKGYEALKFFKR